MPKNAQTTTQLHSSHMLVKYCSKFSKPGFSNTWTMNFLMFKLVLEKAEEPEINLPTSAGSLKKQESSRKISTSTLFIYSALLTTTKTTNCGKFVKRWEYQTTLSASWEICMRVKKHQLELDMDWFQIGEGIHQGCILSPCLFNFCAESVSQFSRPFMSDSLWPHDCCMPGFPFHYQLQEFTQTHVHRVGDAIQPPNLLSPSTLAFNLSQHQGLF